MFFRKDPTEENDQPFEVLLSLTDLLKQLDDLINTVSQDKINNETLLDLTSQDTAIAEQIKAFLLIAESVELDNYLDAIVKENKLNKLLADKEMPPLKAIQIVIYNYINSYIYKLKSDIFSTLEEFKQSVHNYENKNDLSLFSAPNILHASRAEKAALLTQLVLLLTANADGTKNTASLLDIFIKSIDACLIDFKHNFRAGNEQIILAGFKAKFENIKNMFDKLKLTLGSMIERCDENHSFPLREKFQQLIDKANNIKSNITSSTTANLFYYPDSDSVISSAPKLPPLEHGQENGP